jgi:hypothetical protein
LTYNVHLQWQGKDDKRSRSYEEKPIYYRLKKSTDNVHFKRIGQSVSDTTLRVEERWDSTHVTWGASQYLDKEYTNVDTLYYEVEGYTLSGDAEDEDREETIVYYQKASIAPIKQLTIKTLYAESASRKVDITAWSNRDALTEFRIVDMSGRVLKRFQQALSQYDNYIAIPDCDLITGTYILSAVQGEQVVLKKFVIIR